MLFCKQLLLLLISLSLIGCASISQKRKAQEFNELFLNGKYLESANLELLDKSSEKGDASDLLITLKAASSLRFAKQLDNSSNLFDESESIIKILNEKIELGDQLGAILINDAFMDYSPTEYDGVMVNTYKALNFWQQGKTDLARIEFNRALDRQRRAKIRFANEISKQKEAIRDKEKKHANANISSNLKNPKIQNIISQKYSNLDEFEAYPDFVNPFTTYLAGLFFMAQGDYQKSVSLLKESYGMLKNNDIVASDFAEVESLSNGTKADNKYIWVIYENGLGPIKEELRIDLPIFILTNKVKYTGIALPRLKMRNLAHDALDINTTDNINYKTELLCSMDNIIQAEFNKQFPFILTRAIISTAIKTTSQYFAQKANPYAGLAVALYQLATNSADIRIWNTLPKEFHIAKIKLPSDNVIHIGIDGVYTLDINVAENKNALIYIKQPTATSAMIYDVIEM